jgi:hypothetical protein
MNQEVSTFSLIGERYLDTQHDPSYIARLEAELERRGIVGLRRVLYEYVAASGLWWNVFWWNWCSLNERDVRLGWTLNLVLFGVAGIVVALASRFAVGLLAVVVLHVLTLWVGFGLRKGTVRRQ